MTSPASIPLTVQWALHGKQPGDTAVNRVLACSYGDISRENFGEAIGRFNPGTLDELPQVAVSWLVRRHPEQAGQPGRLPVTYLALAIHDDAGGARDATRQKIIRTRYFALPYAEMAAAAVSYHMVYQAMRATSLGRGDGPALRIPVQLATPPAPSATGLVPVVAALLLTGQPICVLGGQAMAMDARLAFIDAVMSLLPYGIRAKMTAATWASSRTAHRFRLFFSDAPRAAIESNDHNVHWDDPRRARIPDDPPEARAYLAWLQDLVSQPMAELGAISDGDFGFAGRQVSRMLESLGVVRPDLTGPGPGNDPGIPVGRVPGRSPHLRGFLRVMERRISGRDEGYGEKILLGINDLIRLGDYGALRTDIAALASFASERGHSGDPGRYQAIISRCQLLRPDLPLEGLAPLFYEAVLRLAFELPLSYQGYCQLEAALATVASGLAPSGPLLSAIEAGGLADPVVAILTLSRLGGQSLSTWFHFGQVDGQELIRTVAGLALLPHHVPLVYDPLQEYLWVVRDRDATQSLQAALRAHGYLAPALQRQLPDDLTYQARTLARLLRDCHGRKLGRDTAVTILRDDGGPPTPALLSAVLGMLASPADAAAVRDAFALGALKPFTAGK